jgi:AcrR family transcriptional regulator
MTTDAEQQGPGRPRDARVDRVVLAATVELMARDGLQDLRMDDVAAKAGVGKAAIYRRYRSKDELVTAAVAALVGDAITIPDTGSTHDDLLVLMREAVDLYTGPLAGRLMPDLVAAMARRPELAHTVRDVFLVERRAALRTVLERGIERGDLSPDMNVELALDMLGGPLFYRLLITGGPLDEDLAAGVAELIMRGFAPVKTKQGARTRSKR